MKRSLAIATAVATLVVGSLAVATPASAVDIRFQKGSIDCVATGYRLTNGSQVLQGRCNQNVRTKAYVRNRSGETPTLYWGTWGRSSTATGPTSMVTGRTAMYHSALEGSMSVNF